MEPEHRLKKPLNLTVFGKAEERDFFHASSGQSTECKAATCRTAAAEGAARCSCHYGEHLSKRKVLEQRFSTFLMLRPFNTVPHVVVTPNHNIISILLHSCHFATVINRSVNVQYSGYLICDILWIVQSLKGVVTPQVENYCSWRKGERGPSLHGFLGLKQRAEGW